MSQTVLVAMLYFFAVSIALYCVSASLSWFKKGRFLVAFLAIVGWVLAFQVPSIPGTETDISFLFLMLLQAFSSYFACLWSLGLLVGTIGSALSKGSWTRAHVTGFCAFWFFLFLLIAGLTLLAEEYGMIKGLPWPFFRVN